MTSKIRVTFRFKILLSVLIVVTTVVSLITFTMARMFHADKVAYVEDLVSLVSVHAAEEANLRLTAYQDQLVTAGRVLDASNILRERRDEALRNLFSRSPGLVALRVFENRKVVRLLLDSLAIGAVGVSRTSFLAAIARQAIPFDSIEVGALYVRNSAISSLLPLSTVAVRVPRVAGRARLVVVGTLDLNRSIALGRSSSAFDVFLVDVDGRIVSHADARRSASRERLNWLPPLGPGSLAMVKQTERDGKPMISGIANVGIGGLRAGAEIPKSVAYFALRNLLVNLILLALGLLVVAAVVSLIWATQMTRSLGQLTHAAQAIGQGNFDVQVAVPSRDEVGQLAGSFNQMASELHGRERALKEAQAQLIQSEKMAAFGQLGAGIAHEVKNPLAGIQGMIQLTSRSLSADNPLHETFAILEKETKRCRAIIDSLLKFARQENLAPEPIALEDVVADTKAILHHELSLHRIALETAIPQNLPLIHGSANQIQQVLMNLILNAEQAMEPRGHGTVEVRAAQRDDRFIELFVKDDGPGIPRAVQARIFEPFFTTKAPGKGTGLGLAVTFGIMRAHGGAIHVESEEGRGTTFILRFRVAGSHPATDAPSVEASDPEDPTPEDRQAA
ncbi:MAG: HAMP domain-containing protein [Candidatus Eisenbacteria bacterium]|uniref:histidine kinase n=1 Tax=Eiseniibacteriota bacterium TaxID=2212470 RepID=A0A538S7J0_UNCEI|nr:MAG: HAMP domain-containing protein [Candidatus Eisenbacteria bacterium]